MKSTNLGLPNEDQKDIEDYSRICIDESIQKQWVKSGDYFVKFSLYNDFSPITTSGGTTLLSNDLCRIGAKF